MADYADGATGVLSLQHGTAVRKVTGTIRSFEQDGETRWEISATHVEESVNEEFETPGFHTRTIGFLPEHVLTFVYEA